MHVITAITGNACNHKSFDTFRRSFVRHANSCKFPASSMEYHTHACNASSATRLMQSCMCYAAPSLVQASACLVAVRSARGVAPPCTARVWSTRTDSRRLAARRGGPKGAFRGTYARLADVSRHTKSRVAVSSTAGEHAPRCPSTARCVADSHSRTRVRGRA